MFVNTIVILFSKFINHNTYYSIFNWSASDYQWRWIVFILGLLTCYIIVRLVVYPFSFWADDLLETTSLPGLGTSYTPQTLLVGLHRLCCYDRSIIFYATNTLWIALLSIYMLNGLYYLVLLIDSFLVLCFGLWIVKSNCTRLAKTSLILNS